jgi:serine protease Do
MNIASSVTKTTDENVETAVISHTVHGYTTDLTEAVSEVQSKVVTVNAFTEDKNISMSGIIYSSSSNGTYIVTSSSSLNEEEAITVRFDNNISLMATIVGTDTETDCAVLLVNPDFDAEAVTLGDSDILKTGEYIFSLSGREEGTDAGIASFGVVSSTAQTQTKSGTHISEVLVSDITLSDISNGAPIFNINGDMVGMLTTELSSSNNKLATAISVNELKLVVDEIISTDTVERGYLGIIGRNISDIQSYEKSFYSLQLDITSGVLVTRVLENSPAINAGIQTNDVIVGIGETEIKDLKSLRECLYKLNTGDTVTVTINRQGNLVTLTVVLE